MEKEVDIVALGELLIDFTEAGYGKDGMKLFEQNPGGAPANLLTVASHILIFLLNRENTILFISPRRYSVPWIGRKTSVSEIGQPCLIC